MDSFGGVILSGDNVKTARCSRAEECALIGPPMVVVCLRLCGLAKSIRLNVDRINPLYSWAENFAMGGSNVPCVFTEN